MRWNLNLILLYMKLHVMEEGKSRNGIVLEVDKIMLLIELSLKKSHLFGDLRELEKQKLFLI